MEATIILESEQVAQPKPFESDELSRITRVVKKILKSEYIIVFGSLGGGTSHSDVPAYDLLITTREEPPYGWAELRRYLKLKFPPKHRDVYFVNPYCVQQQVRREPPLLAPFLPGPIGRAAAPLRQAVRFPETQAF